MQLTLAQATSQATLFAGGRPDWSASDVSFYINQAIGYIARNERLVHTSLESSYATTIASGVSRMRLPTDYDDAVTLSLGSTVPSGSTQWRPLGKQDIAWADTFGGRYDATARPEGYVEYGETHFEIVPSPNSSYSLVLRYHTLPPVITSSSATLPLNERWHWPTVLKAAELLAASREDLTHEMLNRNRYIDYMSTILPDQDKKWMDQRGTAQPLPQQQAGGARL